MWRARLARARLARARLGRVLLASLVLAPGACAGPATIKPLTPLSNVTPDMLNPDGTFKKNGLAPVDPAEQF
jgi:hypothetical protein